ncbi:MAG: hypothetical protein QNJ81_11525 [Acidimicrobiia bacterium]|nr:hypothetical protein [Acidimicrobiia bacterium]
MMSWELARTVLRRPGLWAEALRTLLAVAPRSWWRKPPFVPLPDRAYSSWRLATAHGDPSVPLNPEELVSYLVWRRSQHRPLRRT